MDDKIERLLSKLKQTAIIGSLSAMTLSTPQNVESKEHKQQNPYEQTISQDANSSIIVSQDANSNSQAPSIDREQVIEQLSTEDAKKYTDTQRKYLNDNIKKIMDYDNRRKNNAEYIQKTEQYLEDRKHLWVSLGFNEKHSALENDSTLSDHDFYISTLNLKNEFDIRNEVVKLKEEYNLFLEANGLINTSRFASKLTGLGDVDEAYCISIQTSAMRKAETELGKDGEKFESVREAVGWTCNYASDTYMKNGYGSKHERMDELFTIENGKAVVKHDENGTPMIKDGDLAIIDGYHCIRLNVDENGGVTYSAGNVERLDHKVNSLDDNSCVLLHTQDYAKALAKEYYQKMSNEELLAYANQNSPSQSENQGFEKNLLASSLKRDAKYTLDETLPMSYYAPEFYAWVKETTSHLNTRVDERAQEQRIAQNTNVQQNSHNQALANEGRS